MPWILSLGFALYSLLTFILLFRDERALSVISNFYPALHGPLLAGRTALLHWGLNSVMSLVFLALAVLLFWAYYRAVMHPPKVKTVIIFAAVFLVITYLSYPVLSTDVFDYILSTRLFTHFRQNVWLIPAAAIPADPFYNLASWQTAIYSYGPVNLLIYSLAGLISGNELVVNLLVFKGLAVVFALMSIPLYYSLLREFYPGHLTRGLVLLFWNPLFVIETASSAHNNILAIFFVGLGIYLWKKKSFVLSAVAISLAVQIKYLPVLLGGFLALELLKSRQVRSLLAFVVPAAVMNLVGLSVVGIFGIEYILSLGYGSVYWQSLPMLVHRLLPSEAPWFLIGFLIFLAWQLRRFWSGKVDPLTAYTETLFVYFLLFTGLFWNWYPLWLLPIVPLLSWDRLSKAVVVLTFTALLIYPVYWLVLRFDYRNPLGTVIIYLILAVPPLVTLIYGRGKEISE